MHFNLLLANPGWAMNGSGADHRSNGADCRFPVLCDASHIGKNLCRTFSTPCVICSVPHRTCHALGRYWRIDRQSNVRSIRCPENGSGTPALFYSIFQTRLEFAHMDIKKAIGIILIAAGCLGLAYGGFSYTKETTGMKVGPIELKVQERETVTVPLIVSAAAIAAGIFLLVAVGRK